MAAGANDKFTKSYSFLQKSLAATINDTDNSLTLNNYTNIPTDTKVHFIIDRIDSNGNRTNTARELVSGICTGSAITNVSRGLHSTTAQSHTSGAIVEFVMSGAAWNDLVDGILSDHDQAGYHSKTLKDSNGNEWLEPTTTASAVNHVGITNAATGSGPTVNAKGSDTNVDLNITAKGTGNVVINPLASDGWANLQDTPDTVTYNGNRSYDLVFNSNDLTDTVSEGMRLRLTRTVSAPTQCADLELSSSHYFSKTSPSGISFTTTFTCGAWVKLESYNRMGVIARRNADTEGWSLLVNSNGTVRLIGLRIASNNKIIDSYQSLPLNKWVHIAATMDMTAGDTTAQKIWIDGVEVPRAYTLTGTAAALVQGTTALVVGAEKSDGSNPFDGKIAQAFVNSTNLSTATIQGIISQGLSGAESGMVSAFSLDNSLNDLVTGNANNLTAQNSAAATNVDSPFGNYLGGTLEYGIITKTAFSTNTTLTVQVPEGCAIPTSGGVSAVSYSTQSVPYKFPRDSDRWQVFSKLIASYSQSTPVAGTWYNLGSFQLNIPVGAWKVSYSLGDYGTTNGTNVPSILTTLSTGSSTQSDADFSTRLQATTASANAIWGSAYRAKHIPLTAATTYYLNFQSLTASATTIIVGSTSFGEFITAELAYL